MGVLVVIPARLGSKRLPRKMLADIGGKPLIVRTYESVLHAGVGDVIVACDGEEIASAIEKAGGVAVITDPTLPSGTDRVFYGWDSWDVSDRYNFIVNVQGDMPFIDAEFVFTATQEIIKDSDYDMITVAAPIKDDSYLLDSVVKPVISFKEENRGTALYFSRMPVPYGGPYFHHVGIYGFSAKSLQRYMALSVSKLEKSEKLEQLRMLDNCMSVGITVVDKEPPISVDTEDDLKKVLDYYAREKVRAY
ncbi:MAG: 3-deoxy-manno-octulosonate cytidylyltransferase [Holosporaceae bacterium]|jgi:3-deoxy-manno-octulosonate cytidylyltransferase (CMP-KDO synthetase)|nr:3-deoxy-manno-octulosonate cytidylyltransferase [Holosporaceae bacterium]